ncbi:hypothetical protein AL052_25565 [Pseudomonas amygdali pv. eriobotryae]|nr:hypothetical protein AL052_25565 [Pseudomonas amygdali pv. eriobotryae]
MGEMGEIGDIGDKKQFWRLLLKHCFVQILRRGFAGFALQKGKYGNSVSLNAERIDLTKCIHAHQKFFKGHKKAHG